MAIYWLTIWNRMVLDWIAEAAKWIVKQKLQIKPVNFHWIDKKLQLKSCNSA